MTLRAPYPYFWRKSRAAHLIWDRFGDVANYVGAVRLGSLAVLPSAIRPRPWIETVNDRPIAISRTFGEPCKQTREEAVAEVVRLASKRG